MNTSFLYKTATVCDKRDGSIVMRVDRSHGCGNCARNPGCGLLALPGRSALHLRILNPGCADIEVGQSVGISLSVTGVGRLAAFHYLTIPVSMFAGALLAVYLFNGGGDLASVAGGVAGFFVGCVALKLYDSRAGRYWLDKLEMRHLPPRLSGASQD